MIELLPLLDLLPNVIFLGHRELPTIQLKLLHPFVALMKLGNRPNNQNLCLINLIYLKKLLEYFGDISLNFVSRYFLGDALEHYCMLSYF